MKSSKLVLILLMTAIFSAASSFAATVRGTVHNQTKDQPSKGDSVALVDVRAGMADAATATTDAQGRYSLNASGAGPFLIRVDHQGASYFIAAPADGGSGDVNVYDAAAKVEGVGIDADMLLIEASNGTLRIQERYLIRNSSNPPRTQYSNQNFAVTIPSDAILDGASATRPGGLGTVTHLVPMGAKGHYAFDVPIQPNLGEKETMFEVQYHVSYNGEYTLKPQVSIPADNMVVYLPHSMQMKDSSGGFQPSAENPGLQTYVAKHVQPGQQVKFTVSGEGSVPREQQNSGVQAMGTQTASPVPGGGLGIPIDTPDPLSKYRGWIIAGVCLVLIAGAGFLLRRRGALPALAGGPAVIHPDVAAAEPSPKPAPSWIPAFDRLSQPPSPPPAAPAPTRAQGNDLLQALKEELFTIEKERIDGTLSEEEYARVRAGIEGMLKRTLQKK